jgi:hypothetical protein
MTLFVVASPLSYIGKDKDNDGANDRADNEIVEFQFSPLPVSRRQS